MADAPDTDADDMDDPGYNPGRLAALLMSEIRRARKYQDKWVRKAKRIVKRYRDDHEDISQRARFNILWSNVQTTLPALYAKPPQAVVQRRYLDRDPIGRMASQLLQRCLSYHIDNGDLHTAVRLGVEDMLVVGRGQAWVRYEPKIETVLQPDPTTGIPQPVEQIAEERVCIDYVPWQDFLHGPARTWDEVPWVAKRAYMSDDDLEERFGEEAAKKIPLTAGPQNGEEGVPENTPDELKRAVVWEIWVKADKRVVWVAEGFEDEPLDVKDDPLGLQGFFPCPEPIFATLSTDSLIPIPDYQQYAAQAVEMDELSARIDKLIQAVRVTGVYDSSIPEISRIFTEQSDNRLIAANNWSQFSQAGGFKGAIDYLPIDQIVTALGELYKARQAVKQDIYEITGISDILRGATMASETATAQRIKGQWGTQRLKDRQTQIADFVRNLLRIAGEIISEHFQPQTIIEMSGAQEMEGFDPQVAQQAIELLRTEKLRGFRVDIETDSTIAADEQAEKEARTEFLTAVGGFLQQAIPASQQYPAIMPLLGKMLLFGVRGFRAGRELEAAFEDTLGKLEAAGQQSPQQGQQQQAQADAQAKMQEAASRHQIETGKLQIESERLQFEREKTAAELALRHKELAHKARAERAAQGGDMLAPAIDDNGDEGPNPLLALAQAVMGLQAMVTAPKRIIRDENGRVVGIEPFQPMAGAPQPEVR